MGEAFPSLQNTPPVEIRPARESDAAAVAALHAASWRAHYRGALSDAYLAGPIVAERLAVWTERLTHPGTNQVARLAFADDVLVGFVCMFLDDDSRYGTLIDNLHVAVPFKGRGLGRRLMHAAGVALQHALPSRPAYLYVLEANTAAQRFYDRMGGTVAERDRHTEPDGSSNPVLRYVWATPAVLVAASAE